VLDHELELLQPPVRLLGRLIGLAVRAPTRLRLGGPLVRASEFVDLLARAPDVAPQGVDDRVELRFEVVSVLDETRWRCGRGRSI
jgi:hypothetical protein